MPFTVNMPKLSPTMEEGTITKWNVKEGDKVEAGEVLIEVATDKATVEFNAIDEGYLRKILVPEGDVASINQPIAIFTQSADESIEGYTPEGEKEEKQEEKPEEEEKQKENPKEEEKPKAAFAEPAFVPEEPLDDYTFEPMKAQDYVLASPLAKKIAKEKGLDLSSVRGSGPKGRVMSEDLETAQKSAAVSLLSKGKPKNKAGSYEEQPLSPMRKAIGKKLQQSKTFIPHFYIKQQVDVTSLVRVREELKNCDLKVTFNDFVIRACALALKLHPGINTGYNSKNQTIIQFKTIDISVAVTIDGGLITPIIRYTDYRSLGEISAEVKQLAKKAKEGRLDPKEYQGGSFTVSNLGMFGISEFGAVINPPQSAILAVGGIEDKLVLKEGAPFHSKVMNLVLSCDHRVIDGADGAQFLKSVQKFLENPSILLI